MEQNQDCLHGAGECVQDVGQCDSGCLAKKAAGCQGANCGTTDGASHSSECIVEAAACQGWLNTPEAVDALLKVMVNRFLGWKLPADFWPDCHIHFDREAAADLVDGWPAGTNLLHAGQALEMFKHCLPAELIIDPTQAETDHQCCVKCEKPEADATDPLQPTPEEYQAAITELVTRLRQADAVIVSLLQKAGGEVTLTQADLDGVVGHVTEGDVSEDRSTFTFRAVPVPQQVAQ